ncbi:MAG: tautomerase family protein [Treponema sp.]|nr:tautomerase family protein [Treponema sp.]
MPHITVQMYPGRSDELKAKLAKVLAETASKELERGIEHFSVSIEDVPQDEWTDKVYKKITDPDNKDVFVRPGY